ncbi:MAG: ankyrin repeat domain-containing protein [bacterium]
MKNTQILILSLAFSGLSFLSGYGMEPSIRQMASLATAAKAADESELGMQEPATKKKKTVEEETPQVDFFANAKITLHLAARRGDISAVERLIHEKAPVNIPDGYGMAPLHWAAWTGCKEIVEILLKAGANCNQPCTANGMTALHFAKCYKHTEIIKILLKAGADTQKTDFWNRTPWDM